MYPLPLNKGLGPIWVTPPYMDSDSSAMHADDRIDGHLIK
uniref:Uncharacterized protein n=1 Tax=Arundo donax TaxID=35708 RepID=A0A0A9ADK9_ARUDO